MDAKSGSSTLISSKAVTTDPESETIGAILRSGFLKDKEEKNYLFSYFKRKDT